MTARAAKNTDVSFERIAADNIARRLLDTAADALTRGLKPQWPDLPRIDPITDAVTGAALATISAHISENTPTSQEGTHQ